MENMIDVVMIKDFIKNNGLSEKQFCELCKIDIETFNKIMSDEDFELIALFRVAKVLNVHISKLFIR